MDVYYDLWIHATGRSKAESGTKLNLTTQPDPVWKKVISNPQHWVKKAKNEVRTPANIKYKLQVTKRIQDSWESNVLIRPGDYYSIKLQIIYRYRNYRDVAT